MSFEVPVGFFFENIVDYPLPEGEALSEAVDATLLTQDGMALNKAFVQIKSTKVRRSVIELVKLLAEDHQESLSSLPVEASLGVLRSN